MSEERTIAYRIVAYTVDWDCPLGHKHLHDAFLIGGGRPQAHKSMDELLAMASRGDAFWIEERDEYGIVLDESEATFEPCECGAGHRLTSWVECAERPLWKRKRRKS